MLYLYIFKSNVGARDSIWIVFWERYTPRLSDMSDRELESGDPSDILESPLCRCGAQLRTSHGSLKVSNGSSHGSLRTPEGSLRTSHGSRSCSPGARIPPAIARILCDKCNPKPGDETNELMIVRRRTPEHSPLGARRMAGSGSVELSETSPNASSGYSRTIRRTVSGGESFRKPSLRRSASEEVDRKDSICKLSASTESIVAPRRLFRTMETIQDTV